MSTTTVPVPARILLVEDDPSLLNFLSSLLVDWGYVVDSAHSGQDALDHIRDVCPAVVISDLVMPGMSGMDLLRAIREERKECLLFFILTTGYGTIHNGIDAIVSGADEVLLKPIEPDTLHLLLERHGFIGMKPGAAVDSLRKPYGDTAP